MGSFADFSYQYYDQYYRYLGDGGLFNGSSGASVSMSFSWSTWNDYAYHPFGYPSAHSSIVAKRVSQSVTIQVPVSFSMYQNIEMNPSSGGTTYCNTNAQGGGVRPDGDGYLILNEANYWYNNGNGQPLSADLSKINLRSVSVDDFKKAGDSKYFNLLFYSNSRNDGLVYGSIKLTYMGPTWNGKGGIVSAEYDDYDFGTWNWNSVGNVVRNLETVIGSLVAGPGTDYRIYFYNYGLISGPRPPVIY